MVNIFAWLCYELNCLGQAFCLRALTAKTFFFIAAGTAYICTILLFRLKWEFLLKEPKPEARYMHATAVVISAEQRLDHLLLSIVPSMNFFKGNQYLEQ